jgi:hypothetical protein
MAFFYVHMALYLDKQAFSFKRTKTCQVRAEQNHPASTKAAFFVTKNQVLECSNAIRKARF